MKKNKSVKTCPCGRIITDPKNKTGLCPKCEKAVGRGAAVFGIASLGLWAKKYGPKAIKGIGNVIRNLRKH